MAEIDIPPQYRDAVTLYDDPLDAIILSKCVLLLTPWPIYGALDLKTLECKLAHPIHFFDCWRTLKNIAAIDKVKYWALGVHPIEEE
jgi:hypothetical protein